MNFLVIHAESPAGDVLFPWSLLPQGVVVRHLLSADLPELIDCADFVAVSLTCALQPGPWATLSRLLLIRRPRLIVFEHATAAALPLLDAVNPCVAQQTGDGSVVLQCALQHAAFRRIALSTLTSQADGGALDPVTAMRMTRFHFQGK